MTTLFELRSAVEVAFAARDPQLVVWAPPRPLGQAPAEEEYSRVTNPEQWRILGARADAWVEALTERGLATTEPIALDAIDWAVPPHTVVTSAVRVRPSVPGALPLILARSRIEMVDDAGVTLGYGDPAETVGYFPVCGCDACDDGAQHDLESLDQCLASVITGSYRRLTSGDREISVMSAHAWGASGVFTEDEVDAIIASPPPDWRELSGAGWLF